MGDLSITETKNERKNDSISKKLEKLSLFDNIRQIAYAADPKTHEILYVNSYFQKLLGKDPVGKKCYEIFQNLNKPCDFCTNKIIFKQKDTPYEWEFYNRFLNKYFLITDQVIEWYDGRLVRFEFAIDITNQKLKENSLRRSKEQLKLALKAAEMGSWDWDLDSDTLYWSAELKLLFDLKEDDFDNKYETFLKYVHPDDRQYVRYSIKNTFEQKDEYHIEHRIVWPDGSVHWVLGNGRIIRDKNNMPIRMVGVVQDITKQKKLEQDLLEMYRKLDQESRRLKSILDNAPEGIILSDKEARIMFSNKAAKLLYKRPIPFGKDYQSHSSLGLFNSDGSQIKPKDLPLTRSALYGEIISRKELAIKWPNGQKRYLMVNSSPIKNNDEEIIGAVGLFQDITKRKESEEKIKKLNLFLLRQTENLSSVNEELEAFSYSVSHDLRSPLRSINGFSQALLEDYEDVLDDEGTDYLYRIRKASQRMGELIDALLKLSRISRHQIDYKSIDISKISKSILNSLKRKNPDRDTKIIVEDNLRIVGDKNLIKIALENLIDNAWKFSSKRKKTIIQIGEIVKNGENVFFIKDNGTGFNMNYKDKLFIPFQRLHSSDEFEGHGIGLGIVKRIFNRHNGKIWAESEEGKGTTFYFKLDKELMDV